MTGRVKLPREQKLLLPEAVEDYVAAEAPVRFLDAFVGTLDLRGLGFGKAVAADTGWPPYDPGDLLRRRGIDLVNLFDRVELGKSPWGTIENRKPIVIASCVFVAKVDGNKPRRWNDPSNRILRRSGG